MTSPHQMIEWPSNVKRPTLSQVYTTALRRYGSDNLGKEISRAVLAIYANEVIFYGREKSAANAMPAFKFCGMSKTALIATWAHHRANAGTRYRSLAIMNELIQQCN